MEGKRDSGKCGLDKSVGPRSVGPLGCGVGGSKGSRSSKGHLGKARTEPLLSQPCARFQTVKDGEKMFSSSHVKVLFEE